MNDWFSSFSEYERFKDIAEVLEDAKKLRSLHHERRFDEMFQHITLLTLKYPNETVAWNIVNNTVPRNEDEAFLAADGFLSGIAAQRLGKLCSESSK